MAIPTTSAVDAKAAALLGDPDQEKYETAVLLPFREMATSEMWDCLTRLGIQTVDREATYTLAASTATLTPATAGIADMGEPTKLWERTSGSSDKYAPMEEVRESLPQADTASSLRWWLWEGDTFKFVAATTARQIKIEYSTSSAALIDGCDRFVALRTASLVAASPVCGQPSLAAQLKLEALGPTGEPDGSGGALRSLVLPMVRKQQTVPRKPGRFRPRRNGDWG